MWGERVPGARTDAGPAPAAGRPGAARRSDHRRATVRGVGHPDRNGRVLVPGLGANRPPDDHAEVHDRDLEQHEHEDDLPNHAVRVYAIGAAIDDARRQARAGRGRTERLATLHTALTRWGYRARDPK